MRVLMIEDDPDLCEAVTQGLETAGFATDVCHSGQEGLCLLRENLYDACLLDRMLPELDGLTLLRTARANGCNVPVLMLTALGRVGDRVSGLDAGADDYLVKPFDMRELLARLNALCRRPAAVFGEAQGESRCGNLTLFASEMLLRGPAGEVVLSRRECDLLEVLLKNNGKLLSRSVLLSRVWGAAAEVEESSLDSYIHFVRRRLAAVGANCKIVTLRGTGYKLETF